MTLVRRAGKGHWPPPNFAFSCAGKDTQCRIHDSEDAYDPDIVGPGAIASFIASSAITIICILIAYFNRSIDLDLSPNAADNLIIDFLHNPTQKDGTQEDSKKSSKALDNNKSSEAFESFILAMSDQQLVSQLAILIVVWLKFCDISVYTFEVATALAWLSWTTHLATLSTIHRYFKEHPLALALRLILMAVFLLLLQVALIIMFTKLAGSQPFLRFACVISGSHYGTTTRYSVLFTIFTILDLIVMLFWIFHAYTQRLVILMTKHRSTTSYTKHWLPQLLRVKDSMEKYDRQTFQNHIREKELMSQEAKANKSWKNLLRHLKHLHILMFDSFFIKIIPVLFSFTFGIMMLAWIRNMPAERFKSRMEIIHELSAGQILPILILVLPVLTAAEAWGETRKMKPSPKDKETQPNSSTCETAQVDGTEGEA
ncbi:uncharacterized protein K452DRAFT_363295 [Aplosporella prunicola CBS 121167]|uniref:Uncharacterized protein n=1 Tax=Aplosporella prunicola CBS 121167 TaxID=1176127 RepID=A0A6A6AWN0_9PEZI|nr:uncharacterized protein K452DRAFT_363295 [Aplosporella prunicola CBS 121167]KAF2135197.1 hypothetical protein K452DRAFT_363295 [Aplosporella prunicola CBS 121167]